MLNIFIMQQNPMFLISRPLSDLIQCLSHFSFVQLQFHWFLFIKFTSWDLSLYIRSSRCIFVFFFVKKSIYLRNVLKNSKLGTLSYKRSIISRTSSVYLIELDVKTKSSAIYSDKTPNITAC